jgi:Phage integrase family
VPEHDPSSGDLVIDMTTNKRRGRVREMGLGSCITVSLQDARERALECRKLREKEIDPIAAREASRREAALQRAKSLTFKDAAAAYMATHRVAWKNDKHAAQWPATLKNYAYPIVGDLPLQLIDTKNKIWIVPPERMKAGKEHRVPLSDRAIEILESVSDDTCDRESFVFPGRELGEPLSNMAMLKLLQRMGRDDLTVHGFRSTFRDWAAEKTSFANGVIEMALAHVIDDKTEAAYRRGDLFEKRRRLMEAWRSYCARPGTTNNVLPIRAQ